MKKIVFILFTIVVCAGCANRGIGPQGGPKDTIPPVPRHSVPENGCVNFEGKNIEVTFDEYIQLDNVSQNLLMSPPQQTPPEVKARGKKLTIHFVDSLRDSTTYTLDFGAAVCDFREKNPLRGYTFAFATGPFIDTLELRGRVIDASNLNPYQGAIVGIQENMDDTAFSTMPFTRIARTDSAGFFRIGNMRQGEYRLYALDDVSRDNRFNIGEALAFADQPVQGKVAEKPKPIVPDSTAAVVDSIRLPEDTIAPVEEVRLADENILFLFTEQRKRLYLQRTVREQQHQIRLLFSAPSDSLPQLRALRPSEMDSMRSDSGWIDPTAYMLLQPSARHDTLTYWLTDSLAISQDSIFFEARYQRTDSLYRLEWYTDTLRAVWRAPRLSAKAKEALERRNRNRRLELRSNARQGYEIYDTLTVSCSTPIRSVQPDSVHLFRRKDSLLIPVPFVLDTAERNMNMLRFQLIAPMEAGQQYELKLDSGAVEDVYGIANFAYVFKAQVKKPEDYSTLRVRITPFDSRIRIQLLNNKDEVLRQLPATQEGAFFQYLKPDAYYLRLYIDENGDDEWTTGSWDEKRQPEAIYYYPQKIQTKSNWDFEEEWDYTVVPQLEAKPAELIKASSKKKK